MHDSDEKVKKKSTRRREERLCLCLTSITNLKALVGSFTTTWICSRKPRKIIGFVNHLDYQVYEHIFNKAGIGVIQVDAYKNARDVFKSIFQKPLFEFARGYCLLIQFNT